MSSRFSVLDPRRRINAWSAQKLAVLGAIGLWTASAQIVIDPSTFANGTDVSVAVAGVTLSAPDSGSSDHAVYARDFGGALFSYFDGQYFENFTGGARLKAVFDNPVTAVSVTFGVGGAFQIVGWSGLLLAFDAADVQIDSQTMDFTTDGSYLLQVSGNIKSITATFPAPIGNSTPLDFAGLTRIEAVPEPATWISGIALLGACMALVAQHRMQK